jgi:hypothetical protein
MGDYIRAVNLGSAAVEAHRPFNDAHKYIALSYKALGLYDEAVLMMRRAVRYEQPWDADHVAASQTLLEELIAEKNTVGVHHMVSEAGTAGGAVALDHSRVNLEHRCDSAMLSFYVLTQLDLVAR